MVSQNILFLPTETEALRIEKLQLAECYIIPPMSISTARGFQETSEIRLLRKPGNDLLYIAYNTRWSPLNKTLVRRGLTMAVNKEIIAQAIFDGQAEVIHTPVPSNVRGYDPLLPPYPFSPILAREQFTDAGSRNIEFTLWIQDEPDELLPDPELLGEILKADWALTGVDATIEPISKEQLINVAQDITRPGAVLLWAHSEDGTAEDYLNDLLRCEQELNHSHWCFAPFETNMDAASKEPDLMARVGYYQRAQQVFHEQLPWTPIITNFEYIPLRRNVGGFSVNNIYNLRGIFIGDEIFD